MVAVAVAAAAEFAGCCEGAARVAVVEVVAAPEVRLVAGALLVGTASLVEVLLVPELEDVPAVTLMVRTTGTEMLTVVCEPDVEMVATATAVPLEAAVLAFDVETFGAAARNQSVN